MTPLRATEIGVEALLWLAGQPQILGRLLAASGLAPEELRVRAGDPEMLGFMLEILLQDEPSVLAFTAEVGLPPDAVLQARAALPGGDAPSWT